MALSASSIVFKIAKVLLTVTTFFLILLNIIICCYSLILLVAGDTFENYFLDFLRVSLGSILSIGASLSMFILVNIFFSIIAKKPVVLKIAIVSLSFLLALFVSLSIVGFITKSSIKGYVKNKAVNSMDGYQNKSVIRKRWDGLQEWAACCGVDNYTNWQEKLEALPTSCCYNTTDGVCDEELAYPEGCYEKIDNELPYIQTVIVIELLLSLAFLAYIINMYIVLRNMVSVVEYKRD